MNTKMVAIALSVLMLLTACGMQKETTVQKTMPEVQVEQTIQETTAEPNGDVTQIESTSAEVDKLNEELDTSQFDQMDKELEQIDNLELD